MVSVVVKALRELFNIQRNETLRYGPSVQENHPDENTWMPRHSNGWSYI